MTAKTMDLNQLKRSRTARRTAIGRVFDSIDQAIQDADFNAVETALTQLVAKEVALYPINQALEIEADPDDLIAETLDNEAYADQIIAKKIEANRFLATRTGQTGQTTRVAAAVSQNVKPTVKLPKLQIFKFDGSLVDWSRFWDQFSASIHSNVNLTKIDKFNYLRGLMSPSAALTIQGLQLTEANYDIAVGLLLEKYGKPEVLIEEHIRQLWTIKRVQRTEDGQELRKMLEKFKSHLFALQSLGKDINKMGDLLCQILLQSLPASILLEWNRQTQRKSDDDLMKLLDFVRIELEGIEHTFRTTHAKTEVGTAGRKEGADRKNGTKPPFSSSSSLVAVEGGAATQVKKPFCIFCNVQSHYTSACTQVVTNQDRRNALKANKRCFKCLGLNHLTIDCTRDIKCRSCQQSHHTLLCYKRMIGNRSTTNKSQVLTANCQDERSSLSQEKPSTATEERNKALIASSTSSTHGRKVSVLQAMRLWVRHAAGMHQIAVIIDSGSERSFVTQRLVQQLKLPTFAEEQLTVCAFGRKPEKQSSCLVPLVLVGPNEFELSVTVSQVASICNNVTLWESGCIENFLKSKRVCSWNQSMGTGEQVEIDVLIGCDLYWRVMTGQMKRINSSLMATQSVFGWMLQGCTDVLARNDPAVSMLTVVEDTHTSDWNQQLTRLWELDKAGTMLLEDQSTMTLQDLNVQQHFEETITFNNGRYQVGIPWADNKETLSNNFQLAKERLKRLLFKLQRDPVMLQRYRQGVQEYLNNGHIENVTEQVTNNNPVYYMPHHPIVRDDRKTTKLRIVFDASSYEKPFNSLNECQHIGPNLNPNIFELLLRFRWHTIAISADAEKAFLQIELHQCDRDATRFLWTNEQWNKNEEPSLKIFRMTRVLFGMKSSPYLLAATIRWHVKTHPDTTEQLRDIVTNNVYVDDLLSGSTSVQKALELSVQIEQLMSKGGLLFKKWATNSSELRENWVQKGLTTSDEPVELLKVLGLMWDPILDTLSYKTSSIQTLIQEESASKRGILKILASIYDPLGFVAPKTILAKCLLQDLWRNRLDWDEEIPEHMQASWNSWKEDLSLLSSISLPRCCTINSQDPARYQLHIFCDASPRAYGAAVFLRTVETEVRVNLVTAKTRVSPIALISIPRLELMACVIGKRLADTVLQAWNQAEIRSYFWSDSKVALRWITDSPSRWKVFVGRRVQEIQDNKNPHEWNYCSTKFNIADILTRGQQLSQLVNNQIWWHGPKWLQSEGDSWRDKEIGVNSEITEIVLSEAVEPSTVLVATEIDVLLDVNKFNNWRKLLRVTAWILRFVHKCQEKETPSDEFLSFQELEKAKIYWFKIIQAENFFDERNDLRGGLVINSKSRLVKFRPWIDDEGLMRLGGRLKFAQLSLSQQHPILLQDCHAVKLFIQYCHLQTMHGGVQTTLLKVRETAWVLKGRQSVRKAIHGCISCRKWDAKPATMEEAPLPSTRITQSPPFFSTGLDFAGPLWIKNGQQSVKAYICLFTCAVVRAIHLELVSSQGIKPFLLAFRRFIARRGACRFVYSDNAQTFKQASRLVMDSSLNLQNKEVQEQVTKSGVQWRFIAPLSPWWGGFYERLVSTVKKHLRRALGSALLDFEEMTTILAEIEAVINSRPLVSITEDVEDATPLSPAHFLLGRSDCALTEVFPHLPSKPAKLMLTKRWKFRKRLMDNFWHKWQEEYLLQLRSMHTTQGPTTSVSFKVGDIVLIKEARLPRGQWKMAKVQELTQGRDNQVRSVMLKTSNGKFLRRAVQNLCPLEIT